eukprot:TRINITY_DN7767_c0_g1_i1.p1 TRINITY_DN7767_c0_g1~~TRINITY_DN7767_c0_g1_i1.p1  ORF type:complete len:357 (-),score=69.86 TRINITY_DN7767_c0_g1_i1:142-1212(-)
MSELADSKYNKTALLVVDDIQGDSREWFELFNRAGITMGFAVVIENTLLEGSIEVTGLRQGFVTGWIQGPPLASMFSTEPDNSTVYTLMPGQFLPILRQDSSVPNNTVFSGVVDFTIKGGPARVWSIVYVDYDAVDLGDLQYEGYITRTDPTNGESEARVYKGFVNSAVMASNGLNFVLDDTLDYPAVLPVTYNSYDLALGRYATSSTIRSNFTTNITPFANPAAVTSDMEPIWTPGWGLISPVSRSDATSQYPNFGNWGVLLEINGEISNQLAGDDASAINVSFSMQTAMECLTNLAYRDSEGIWRSTASEGESPVVYYNITVFPGETIDYSAQYVLGGSSCGNLVTTVLATLIA